MIFPSLPHSPGPRPALFLRKEGMMKGKKEKKDLKSVSGSFTAPISQPPALLYCPREQQWGEGGKRGVGGGDPIIYFLIVSTEKHSNKMPVTGAPPANGHTVRRPCKQPCWCLIEVLKDWAQQNQASAFWQTGEAASLLPISSLTTSARPAWTVHLLSGCLCAACSNARPRDRCAQRSGP